MQSYAVDPNKKASNVQNPYDFNGVSVSHFTVNKFVG